MIRNTDPAKPGCVPNHTQRWSPLRPGQVLVRSHWKHWDLWMLVPVARSHFVPSCTSCHQLHKENKLEGCNPRRRDSPHLSSTSCTKIEQNSSVVLGGNILFVSLLHFGMLNVPAPVTDQYQFLQADESTLRICQR